MDLITQILLSANSAAEAMSALYKHKKSVDKKFSLAYIARKANITSRGYVSDIVSGRRAPHVKYHSSLPRAFGLKADVANYLRILMRRDGEEDPDKKARWQRQLEAQAKILRVQESSLPIKTAQTVLAFEIFCILSLYPGGARREQIQKYIGQGRVTEVDAALAKLLQHEIIQRDGEGRYQTLTEFILFKTSVDGASHVEFVKTSIQSALEKLDHWFHRPAEAVFQSSIISVDASVYKRMLPKIKSYLLGAQTKLESSRADMLVRFNVQIFPDQDGKRPK